MPKVRDAIRLVERDGLVADAYPREPSASTVTRDKPGTVTISGRPGDDLPRGTWASVMKQAGLKE